MLFLVFNVNEPADYYPFGIEVRSRGIKNRYGYQGLYAEKDKETGWNNFELRNYDAAIGRWLTTDPYGQYDSPYVGMGNNPIKRLDKDGGWANDNIGVNRKGEVVFDGGKKDGNLFLVNEGVGKIKDLAMLKSNSIQLAKYNAWIGTDQQKIDYVKSQWKFAEGGFDWFPSTNKFVTDTKKQTAFSVDAFMGDNVMTGANNMFNIIFTIQDQGVKSTVLSDPYNTRNAISHEKRHLLQSVKVHHGSLVNPTITNLELDAIRYQRSVKSWQNTTEKFKRGTKGYENKFAF
ncbi:MAG: RHS repeat-associated core domain-containing protein [Sphingobacterium sp.]|nr:RHS repeat-associated core domain-containing protein [Sphingobacterium sp.]